MLAIGVNVVKHFYLSMILLINKLECLPRVLSKEQCFWRDRLRSTPFLLLVGWHHRYQKTKNRLLKVCYGPASSTGLKGTFSFLFLNAAVNSTNAAEQGRRDASLSSLYT